MVDIAELHHDPVANLVNRVQAKTMHPLQDCVPAPQGGQRPAGLQHHGGQGQVPRHEQVRCGSCTSKEETCRQGNF